MILNMLTDILATNDWHRLAVLADYLHDTKPEDAAWLRKQTIKPCGRLWHASRCINATAFYDTEADAIDALFTRVLARFGLEKADCWQCKGYGIVRVDIGYGDNREDECPSCVGRGWNLVPIERVPCQRCGGDGKYRWAGEVINHQKCGLCQGQGAVPVEQLKGT